MNHPDDTLFKRWLAAEEGGRDAVAEQALEALFSALPSVSPTAGFAGRVMAATSVPLPWWHRAAIAACLLVTGLTAASGLPLAVSLVRGVAPAELIGTGVQALGTMASRIDELLSLWSLWLGIVDTVLLIATAPPVVWSLLTLTALSALTFRGLKRALVPYRSPDHVPI